MNLAFVLIHGGGLDTWVWERMIPQLNFPALAVGRAAPGTNLNRLTILTPHNIFSLKLNQQAFKKSFWSPIRLEAYLLPPLQRCYLDEQHTSFL